MEAKDRIIVALDVSSAAAATKLVRQLHNHVGMFKIGFELIYAMFADMLSGKENEGIGAFRDMRELFELLDGNVFMDVKLHDIPNTVAGAAKAIARLNPKMFNVHASGGPKMMWEARKTLDQSGFGHVPIIAVTLLTSLDFSQMREMGYLHEVRRSILTKTEEEVMLAQVVHLAGLSKKNAMAGVVASAKETIDIKNACGSDFLVVTPGIRPTGSASGDQARVTTPTEAIFAGSDYLVIGRPITDQPNPADAAKRIAEEMELALERRKQ